MDRYLGDRHLTQYVDLFESLEARSGQPEADFPSTQGTP
jgi:hypothetical protein